MFCLAAVYPNLRPDFKTPVVGRNVNAVSADGISGQVIGSLPSIGLHLLE